MILKTQHNRTGKIVNGLSFSENKSELEIWETLVELTLFYFLGSQRKKTNQRLTLFNGMIL